MLSILTADGVYKELQTRPIVLGFAKGYFVWYLHIYATIFLFKVLYHLKVYHDVVLAIYTHPGIERIYTEFYGYHKISFHTVS